MLIPSIILGGLYPARFFIYRLRATVFEGWQHSGTGQASEEFAIPFQ
jgi:hypothetical protein